MTKLEELIAFQKRELRGYIDRTLDRYSVEIGQKAANYANEPCNAYLTSVIAFVELRARESAWYRKFEPAPVCFEPDLEHWAKIDLIAEQSAPLIYEDRPFSFGLNKLDDAA